MLKQTLADNDGRINTPDNRVDNPDPSNIKSLIRDVVKAADNYEAKRYYNKYGPMPTPLVRAIQALAHEADIRRPELRYDLDREYNEYKRRKYREMYDARYVYKKDK